MKSYYLYRHVDLVNNIPFYIGIGTNEKYFYYRRSKNKTKRSREWKEYLSNINENYRIDIIFETEDFILINEKETEFIKLYGRKDLELGNLVNKNNGGRGKKEYSKETINSIIKKQKCKPVVVYNYKGEKLGVFDRSMSASEFSGVPYLSVKQCLMKKHEQSRGFRFRYLSENLESLPPIELRIVKKGVPIICENDITKEIKTFNNMRTASRELNIPEGTIGNNLKGVTKFAKKVYKFRYIDTISKHFKEKGIISNENI